MSLTKMKIIFLGFCLLIGTVTSQSCREGSWCTACKGMFRYGKTKFAYTPSLGLEQIRCHKDTFGGEDPEPEAEDKGCDCIPHENAIPHLCGGTGHQCSNCRGLVQYGKAKSNRFIYKVIRRPFICGPSAMGGDPQPGTSGKECTCYNFPERKDDDVKLCSLSHIAEELDHVCNCPNNEVIYMDALGGERIVKSTGPNGIRCTDSVFGTKSDKVKGCYCRNTLAPTRSPRTLSPSFSPTYTTKTPTGSPTTGTPTGSPTTGTPTSSPTTFETSCAEQNEECRDCTGVIRYGYENKFVFKTNFGGTVLCSNAFFGRDPFPGETRKACTCLNFPLESDTHGSLCAGEKTGETCTCPVGGKISFTGRDDSSDTSVIIVTEENENDVECSVAGFGGEDPAVGSFKSCYCDDRTQSPTLNPTSNPTSSPTLNPTSSPTSNPTSSPTSSPTRSPTSSPNVFSSNSNPNNKTLELLLVQVLVQWLFYFV